MRTPRQSGEEGELQSPGQSGDDGMQHRNQTRSVSNSGDSETSSTVRSRSVSYQISFHDKANEENFSALTPISSEEEDHAEVRQIASLLSRSRSSVSSEGGAGGNSAATDPDGPDFDLNSWLRSFIDQIRDLGFSKSRTGVAFRGLDVFGSGSAIQVQQTTGSLLATPLRLGELFSSGKKEPKHILRGFNGLIKSGELLAVLGRPGSGCSTLLKSLCGELHGLKLGDEFSIHYGGVPQKQMQKEFKGEAVYNQEAIGQTLEFAASVRAPAHRIQNMTRDEYCKYTAKVVMTIFGLRHTYNTKVGNEFVRGVSGGERKRVSISEMVLAGSPFGAWDNSTRGLDSASALNFIEALRKSCDLGSHANAVSIYQASQSIYDLFDKATVLYEGRQVYFGPAAGARQFFEKQGWHCPPRQTTGDFLTSITNPSERRARAGMESRVPRTAEDFERYWRASPEFMTLVAELDEYDSECCGERQKESIAQLRQQKNFRQAKHVRAKSPYTVGTWMQVRLNCKRAYQRIWNDITATAASTLIQVVLAIILGSIFIHTPDTTDGFFAKGATLFTAVLLSALVAILEVTNLYNQRPIVEKHASYAFYHPFTEAAAGIVLDIPLKLVTSIFFNTTLYFMAGLRREAGPFFLFFLITYVAGFVMTAAFRTIAAITKTVSQAMTLAGVMVLALVIYSGFIITVPEMHPWFGWIRWVNPIFYAFEILVANEFHDREFRCAARSIVPAYKPPVGDSWICSVTGAVAGQMMVSGDAFIEQNYHYHWSHVWRNFGILLAFLALFMFIYFLATELNSSPSSTRAESLVFRRGHVPSQLLLGSHAQPAMTEDEHASKPADARQDPRISDVGGFRPQSDVFAWKNVVLDIMIKDEKRRLLDHVDGWVKPGTLTALMGVSGAGKTTLLDVLAQRSTVGVISGDMLVNGRPRGPSFQRSTGYVQQQDLHVHTDTVRESLRFSAMLRRPRSVSKEEKYAFVEEVIKMLNMEEFASAVVGVPGQGLNLEQRKLLTIGVELAAKPELLLFLDEPTSGLDSQSSWAICAFLRKLADSGQAILCTVHQPSAVLFQQFDRLLFLAEGGRTVYFGDIGDNSQTLLGYFEGNGARKCGDAENPAEYMIEIVNEGANDTGRDWHSIWRDSPEYRAARAELDRMHAQNLLGGQQSPNRGRTGEKEKEREKEKEKEKEKEEKREAAVSGQFAMPLSSQMVAVTARMLRQYWRSPSYIMAKVMLGIAAGLFVGFTFYNAKTTLAGMQNIIFSIFMLASIFTTLVQQIHPVFIAQRDLYEVRERPSKTYSWVAFIVANLLVEIPYQVVTAVLTYACIYFPIVGAGQSALRQGLVFLCIMQLFVFASAFAHMTIVAMPNEQTAASIVAFMSTLSLIFSGVLETPDALPVFWRDFLYRVSPFTYWISTIVSTSLHGRPVVCSQRETSVFDPPANLTCGEYLALYLREAPGHLQNPMDTLACRYCTFTVADQSIELSRIRWDEKWRNYGIMWGYIGFNLLMAIFLYYIFRVKQWKKK